MTRLKTAPLRASQLGPNGRKEAARLYNDVEHELALGDPSPEDEASGESALRILEHAFTGIQSEARDVETPPRLSQTAGRRLSEGHGGRRRRSNATATRPGPPASSSRRSPRGPAVARPRATPARAAAPARAVQQVAGYADRGTQLVTGDTASSWGSLALDIFLGGIVLSLAFLLITHAKGPSELFSGGAKLVSSVVSPHIDPLNPTGVL